MKLRSIIFLVLVVSALALSCAGATPTFVQATSCSESAAYGGGSSPWNYACQLPELTLANNLVVVGVIYDNSTTPTVAVTLKNAAGTTIDTMTQVVTNTTANANVQRIYKVATAGAAKYVNVNFSAATGFVGVLVIEFYNVNTTASGTALCNRVSSGTVTTGNITVGNGNLLVQTMFPDDTTASGALTAGSGMSFAATDRNDSEAVQYRLGTGSAINPTITQGTSHQTASCAAGFTAASVGTAPSTAFRVLRLAHAQMPASSANPYILQVPIAGNLAVIDMHGGGDSITGITDTGSNTWTCRSAAINGLNADQICWAPIITPSNAMAINITRGGATKDATFMTYDITGADTTPRDGTGNSGTGSTANLTGPITTCSSCYTPPTTGDLMFSSEGHDFCTTKAASAPSGNLFNSSTFLYSVHIDGPEPVDQNNGWLMYRVPSVTAVSMTWTIDCTGTGGTTIGNWSWSVESFKAPAVSVANPRLLTLGVGW